MADSFYNPKAWHEGNKKAEKESRERHQAYLRRNSNELIDRYGKDSHAKEMKKGGISEHEINKMHKEHTQPQWGKGAGNKDGDTR